MSTRENAPLQRRKALTELAVDKLKPPTERQYDSHYDALLPGLVLRVNAGGAKVWHALYYRKTTNADGKRITIATTRKLGRYPVVKVKEAREKARQFLADPQKALAQAADSGSFRKVAESFLKRHVEANKLRSQPEIERCLNKYILPAKIDGQVWGDRPFRELRRGDVATLLDKIQDEHGARQADICLAIIRKLTHWYQARNDDYVTPVVRGMGRSKPGDRKRKRILDDDEIKALWTATADMGSYGAILRCCLLTAQRVGKVAAMRWDDIKDGVWEIPVERREKSHAESLRLPPMVLDIINAQPRLADNPYVFAGSARGRRRGNNTGPASFNSFSQRKEELDAKLPTMPPWVIHDLRRTARSLMSRAGVRPDIAERVLGHAIPGVEGVYDRHDYAAERADALNRLAALVNGIVNPPSGNVVALPAGRRAGRRRTR